MRAKQKTWVYIAVVGIVAALGLKTVWWSADKVLPEIGQITEALVVEAPYGRQAYADEETVKALAELLSGMELRFDRKSDTFDYEPEAPAYQLMLSGDGFSYGVISVSDAKLHYNSTTYIIREEDAEALNIVLAGCFS